MEDDDFGGMDVQRGSFENGIGRFMSFVKQVTPCCSDMSKAVFGDQVVTIEFDVTGRGGSYIDGVKIGYCPLCGMMIWYKIGDEEGRGVNGERIYTGG